MPTSQPPRSGWLATTLYVAAAVVAATTFRTLAYDPFYIPSPSMHPTLIEGDHILVSKFSYGYSRYSLPFGAPLIDGRTSSTGPERGDIVVFKTTLDGNQNFIKRVIGLPGDEVEVRDGVLLINGTPVGSTPVEDAALNSTHEEKLPEGRSYTVLDQQPDSPGDHFLPITVPEGHYFVLGDNRDNSKDSRFEIGFIPSEHLIGRADYIFYSAPLDVSLFRPWQWDEIRFDRMFEAVR